MTRLCFIDTETTSLRPDRRAWEVGLIVRDPGAEDREFRWFIQTEDLDLGNADPFSLKIGRFYERHPDYRGTVNSDSYPEAYVLCQVEKLTRGAYLVGAIVSFDADVLGTRMRAGGICPAWDYHLMCIENLAAGWLHASAAALEIRHGASDSTARNRTIASPPWKSDELTRALGVTITEADRHTALGDARWARDVYDVVAGPLS
jgi:DNA polymerase III epsilon subunit-like protein